MIKTLVITALGRESFSDRHLGQLDELGSVDVVGCSGAMSDIEFVRLARPYDVVALTRRPKAYLRPVTLSQLPKLRAVVVHTTGVHWIDTDYLHGRAIPVFSLGGYATDSVAEQTLAGLLTLSRRTHLSIDRSRGLIPPSISLRGFELTGRTIGLIGYGRIGRRIHQLLEPFNSDVLIHDPAFDRSLELDSVLDRSDLLVLAASQRYGRPPIIGARELAATSARYIVNAACDELVDHVAIVDAVKRRQLDGYLLDEFDETLANADVEPGRIIQTMHTGWYSDEAMARGKDQWLQLIEQAVVLVERRDEGGTGGRVDQADQQAA